MRFYMHQALVPKLFHEYRRPSNSGTPSNWEGFICENKLSCIQGPPNLWQHNFILKLNIFIFML